MKKIIIFALLLFLFIPIAFAQQGHLTLLTVSETNDNQSVGGTADLFLEIKPGNGRVFIDSFPLTRLDTQISTRFAKDIACEFLEYDCSNKDFFYTIRARAPIVGGPSAGAAITVLTTSMLDNSQLNKDVVITGTINAGGLIGPVAGLEEKSKAAKNAGFKKVIVPKWSILPKNNKTANVTYANSLNITGITVKPVSTLEEALFEFTGKKYEEYSSPVKIPDKYQKIMKKVSNLLCSRYTEIKNEIPKEVFLTMNVTYNKSKETKIKAKNATEIGDFYSSASYCFTANTNLRTIQYSNYTNESLEKVKDEIKTKTERMIGALNTEKFETMSDLETYIIVKERLYETRKLLDEENVFQNLGYIRERMYSAVAWSAFFDYDETSVSLDETYLENACLSKIAEAEERESYVDLLFGNLISSESQIEEVKKIYEEGDFAFCLFRASKLKSDANTILATQGLTFEKLPELVDDQLNSARKQINKQGEKFPILGYSYYNYANSLKNDNSVLAALFSGYSNELSNLNMYFPKQTHKSFELTNPISFELILGFMLGILVSIFFIMFSRKK